MFKILKGAYNLAVKTNKITSIFNEFSKVTRLPRTCRVFNSRALHIWGTQETSPSRSLFLEAWCHQITMRCGSKVSATRTRNYARDIGTAIIGTYRHRPWPIDILEDGQAMQLTWDIFKVLIDYIRYD